MRYNIAVHSPGDCIGKLGAINAFSRFLAQKHPLLGPSSLNRTLIVEYIAYLHDRQISDSWECHALVTLRTLLEVSAYRLSRQDLPKERLIFDDDLPKEKKTLPREIPEEVLVQIREHLETLDTPMLRMVTILLECGLRISELCTLPFDCLMCDDKHEWYLKFYQIKLKQEHVIPLVNETVVAVIQAQQEDTRAQWGDRSPYLFTRPLKRSRGQPLPFVSMTFANRLNRWALEKNIRDRHGRLYHLQSHQFRHSVGIVSNSDIIPKSARVKLPSRGAWDILKATWLSWSRCLKEGTHGSTRGTIHDQRDVSQGRLDQRDCPSDWTRSQNHSAGRQRA